MQSEAFVHTAYFDLEVLRPEDFLFFPHVWEEPEEPYLRRLMRPVKDAVEFSVYATVDGHTVFLPDREITVAELIDVVQNRARRFLERIVGTIDFESRDREVLKQELRRLAASEQRLEQLRMRARIREGCEEPQIPIVDTPIEPMAPCASMSS